MVNAQEYLDQNFPKEGRSGVTKLEITYKSFGGHLDLRDFVNLKKLHCSNDRLTSLDLSKCGNLEELSCSSNQLTSVGFLNTLPNLEKSKIFIISSNNIQPTDIEFFSKFVNLRILKIGTFGNERVKYNRFYGSLKSYQNLTKLEEICIEATDVNEGLEYLPESLVKGTKWTKYRSIECSPRSTNAKCKAIQNELRPFNYDLEAWQLAHPEKMLIARPELFTNPDSRDKWIKALKEKIKQSQQVLKYIIQNEPNKEAKIIRLETQIKILEEVESQLREEIENEREIHADSMKAMDNFYQQNPPREDIRLDNILREFEKNYLELNREKQVKEQEIKELKGNIEITKKIIEQEYQPKATKEQGTQTELTGEELEKQQKENQELREQIKKLTLKKY